MKRRFKIFLVGLLFLSLLAFVSCQGAATATSPSESPSALNGPPPGKLGTVEKDVVYGNADGVVLKLDIYYPAQVNGDVPAIIYVHGGSWTGGDKSSNEAYAEIHEMNERGYLVASINYRLASEYKFPAQEEDVKCAVRFLREKSSIYGITADKIGACGKSAGGHLVALLGTTDPSVGFEGEGGYSSQSSRVQAVVDMFGPTDIATLFPGAGVNIMEQVFGTTNPNSEVAKKASPVTYVSSDAPPFLILHGDRDGTVPLSQSQEFYDKLAAANVPVQLVVVKNAGHMFFPFGGAISPTLDEINDIVADFFDKYLHGSG